MVLYEKLYCSLKLLEHFATVERQLHYFVDLYEDEIVIIDHLIDWSKDETKCFLYANELYMKWFLTVDITELKTNTYTAYMNVMNLLLSFKEKIFI